MSKRNNVPPFGAMVKTPARLSNGRNQSVHQHQHILMIFVFVMIYFFSVTEKKLFFVGCEDFANRSLVVMEPVSM